MDLDSPQNREVLTVGELNARVRQLIDEGFPPLLVEGEISNLARPSSGHWYFTLKDAGAQVRCACFINRNRRVRLSPRDGMQVLLHARASLYEGRGEFQLVVDYMEEVGDGVLRRRFEELKGRLQDEGLFDADRKRELPPFPRHVAAVTSPTGAAVRDFVSVMKRRFPLVAITVLPATVQGPQAVADIVAGIERAQAMPGGVDPVDVIVVARGGGSLEDLWAFNEEKVARAIDASQIPVVSAVGHEVDFTIADLVADVRAPTPSAAAELISPEQAEVAEAFRGLQVLLQRQMSDLLLRCHEQIDALRRRLRHPGERLRHHMQRLDDLELGLVRTIRHWIERTGARVDSLRMRLGDPGRDIEACRSKFEVVAGRLHAAVATKIESCDKRLSAAVPALNALNPINTLDRGYAIVSRAETGEITTDAGRIAIGEAVHIRLGRGALRADVTAKTTDS